MFTLKIATPDKLVFENEVLSVTFQTDEGEQTILPGHGPFIGEVVLGELHFVATDKQLDIYALDAGFYEIRDNTLNILVYHATRLDEIDITKAEEIKVKAQSELSSTREEVDLKRLELMIKRADLHIAIHKKHKQ